MPYCPTCYAEYQEGVLTCADDGTPLVEGTPHFCPHCDAFVEEPAIFCGNCGRLQPLPEGVDKPECDNHPDRPAVGNCVLCGKPLCKEDIRKIDDAYYCEDDSHVRISQEYVAVYKTNTDYEADMLVANLQGAGIDAVAFNQHDHVYFVNLGALAVVKIMVQRKDAERAKEIIDSILTSDESEEPEDENGQPESGDEDKA